VRQIASRPVADHPSGQGGWIQFDGLGCGTLHPPGIARSQINDGSVAPLGHHLTQAIARQQQRQGKGHQG
jgi:hypothetical protein